MAWAKWSDTAGNHPYFARVFDLEYYDPWLKNELFGFLGFCASQSAQFFTDYMVEEAKVKELGGMIDDRAGKFRFNYERLLDAALRTGFFEGTYRDKKGRVAYKILEDPENFVHIIRRAEDDWNKGRQRDLNDTDLKGKVRMRDGDQCRWCGKVVNWSARTGGRAGTYDHVVPGETADGDPGKLYVACTTCNKARQDGRNWQREPRPTPKTPYFSEVTVKQLAEWGFNVVATEPPLFDEVDPTSDESPRVEPEKSAPQVEAAERPAPSQRESDHYWTPVDPTPVETARVEPYQASQQTPGRPVPDTDQADMIRRFEQDLLEGELESAPSFVTEAAAHQPAAVHANPVEPEKSAPGRAQAGDLQDSCRSRQKPALGILGTPGRDGQGRAEDHPKSETKHPSESELPAPKRRRRRRRRKPKSHA